jgi:hypothetical protein
MIRRLVTINEGVIGGFDKELIESILPQLQKSFRQRKEFWEYYFEDTWVFFSIEDLEKLSSNFLIEVGEFDLTIKI